MKEADSTSQEFGVDDEDQVRDREKSDESGKYVFDVLLLVGCDDEGKQKNKGEGTSQIVTANFVVEQASVVGLLGEEELSLAVDVFEISGDRFEHRFFEG